MVDQMDAGKLLARNGCSEPSRNIRKHRTKINVKGRTLNNGINPLKYRQIYMYIYVDYPEYKIIHMVMGIKFRTTQDVRASDACNIDDYILARQHYNIFSSRNKKCMP